MGFVKVESMRAARPWPIYLAAAVMFAGLQARTLLVPLRVHELGGSRVEIGLLYSTFTIAAAGLAFGSVSGKGA